MRTVVSRIRKASARGAPIRWWAPAALLASLALLTSCSDPEPTRPPGEPGEAVEDAPEPTEPETTLRESIADAGFEAIAPPESEASSEPAEVARFELGRRLFHDAALSADGTVSCGTCHLLSHAGAEPRAASIGIRGRVGDLNAPTVLDSAGLPLHGWLAAHEDLEATIAWHLDDDRVLNAGEEGELVERLEARDVDDAFEAAFGDDGVTRARVIDALGAYLRGLVAPAAFDRWLDGDDDALDAAAQRGLRRFVELGCAECHTGPGLGGHELAELGVEHDYYERRGGRITEGDRGAAEPTAEGGDDEGGDAEEDDADEDGPTYRFRVAPLRHVVATGPYLHDGSEPSLEGAVRTMAHVQLDRELEDDEVADVVAFLGALTGEIPPRAFVPGAPGAPEPPPAADDDDAADVEADEDDDD